MGSSVTSCIRKQSKNMFIKYVLFLCFVAGLVISQEDECYREKTNCYREDLNNEIGHVPYMKEIWACELACRETGGCNWFTWYENSGFYMCYLLTSCEGPLVDSRAVSARLDECTPDTTPTIRPTWTPPHN